MEHPNYDPNRDPELEELLRAADAALGDAPAKDDDPFDIQLPPEVYGPDPAETFAQEQPAPQPAPSVIAYNADRVPLRHYNQPEAPTMRIPNDQIPYYDEPIRPEPESYEKPKKRKKSHKGGILLLLMVVLIAAPIFWLLSYIQQPVLEGGGARKSGCSTILICGSDASGTLTDTMMLFSVNIPEKQMSLVSLPRDTATRTAKGNLAKLNSAYSRNGSGESGMEGLMDYVEEIIGFRPDGYMLIDLNCFVDIVDLMGGVDFEVPQDMYYSDPDQDLYIDLQAGMQHLDGYDAMCLVRFRKGYATQDLGRVDVQRQVLAACLDQWMTIGSVTKVGKVLDILGENTISNLSNRNLLWLAQAALRCGIGNLQTETMPGTGDYIGDVSYYLLDREDTADLVNRLLNPYEEDVKSADLTIVN